MTKTRSATDASVDSIVHDLYAGTLDEAVWNRALVALADLIHASAPGSRAGGASAERYLESRRRLLPHVMRALEIRDRLEQAKTGAALASALNKTLSLPIIVLDVGGKILEANPAARERLRVGDGVRWRPNGFLWVREPAGAQLDRWISAESHPAKRGDGLLRVSRSVGPPISILVTPLPESVTSGIAGEPRWLLVVFDPDRRVRPSAELLARDLGISASEARVAALLAAGHSLRAVASRLGKSHHTVRAQVKSIFRRTGIGGQSELIRRVLLGPAIYGTSDDSSLR